jgi:hypothetical protein
LLRAIANKVQAKTHMAGMRTPVLQMSNATLDLAVSKIGINLVGFSESIIEIETLSLPMTFWEMAWTAFGGLPENKMKKMSL